MTGQINWRRAEFVLTLCAFVGFITLLIRVTTVWGGLPAHPLFVHVPVILIPVTVLGTLVCIARPTTFDRYGVLLCAVSIIAMSSTFLAMQAGGALSHALNLQGEAAQLISQHSQAAKILAVGFTLMTAILILTFASHRIRGGMPTGIGIADDLLGSTLLSQLLKVVLVVLALFCAFYIFRVGDLGARAVWAGRLQAAAHSPA
jgi:hypothetical protein